MFRIIVSLGQQLLAKLFAIYLRYVIGFAFDFASFVKKRGERFTSILPDQPAGCIFEAICPSGF